MIHTETYAPRSDNPVTITAVGKRQSRREAHEHNEAAAMRRKTHDHNLKVGAAKANSGTVNLSDVPRKTVKPNKYGRRTAKVRTCGLPQTNIVVTTNVLTGETRIDHADSKGRIKK